MNYKDVDHNTAVLRHSAYLSLDASAKQRFITLANEIDDWDGLVKNAESHALSNLLYSHLSECEIEIPSNIKFPLKALTARHQRLNRERSTALDEILTKFNDIEIEPILLKGMALINCLYTNHSQRPMGDIDILVAGDKALAAQQALREIGYNAGDRKQGYLYDHHHLPVATCKKNGLTIQVEIHHNALSGDVGSDMTFDQVANHIIPMNVNGNTCYTLGHIDMIKHLCHHTFEPCDRIKLGAVADIYSYTRKFFHEIDWQWIKQNQPFSINTLRCLHYLTPLPEILAAEIIAPTAPAPKNVGEGFPTLSSTMNSNRSFKDKLRRLFFCSDWWRHIYYVTPPENSLIWVKITRHPLTILRWFARRFVAKTKSNKVK